MVDCKPGKERIIKFDEGAPCGRAIRPLDKYMRWCMHVKEVKTLKAGRTRKQKVVYELQVGGRYIKH
jgi:hypothetical protein